MSKPDARSLAAELAGLTVLRPLLLRGALRELCRFLEALCGGDTFGAQRHYHEMFWEMLKTPRLTGEVFRDYWIYSILTCPNEFTKAAMRGVDDAVINAAMERDLRAAQRFCQIGGNNLSELTPLKPGQNAAASDAIVRMAGAAWGGVEQKKPPTQVQSAQGTQRVAPPLWRYDRREDGFTGFYAQDALDALLDIFETEGDWANLRRPLHNLFANHGDIARFKYEQSYFSGEALVPLRENGWLSWNEFVGMEGAQDALLERAEGFLADKTTENLLLHGDAGLGKTSLVCALAQMLSIRLIITTPENWDKMGSLLAEMREQPMKFIVLIDDIRGEPPEALNAYAQFAQSPNVWLIATSREALSPRFARPLPVEPPPLKAFIQCVMQLARESGFELDYDSVQDVCIDWKVDGGELTASAALKVLAKLTDL